MLFFLGGYLAGRVRSLPILKPGQRVVFRTQGGMIAADMVLAQYSVRIHEGVTIELVSRSSLMEVSR